MVVKVIVSVCLDFVQIECDIEGLNSTQEGVPNWPRVELVVFCGQFSDSPNFVVFGYDGLGVRENVYCRVAWYCGYG